MVDNWDMTKWSLNRGEQVVTRAGTSSVVHVSKILK